MQFKALKASLFTGLLAASVVAQATIVRFETSLGDIDVNLFDEYTPETVANFLAYVESGAYSDTFIHRSVRGFVVQGGGFAYDSDYAELEKIVATPHIETRPPVINEPVLSNQRGTISMAKSAQPNSATSEWFFNVADNSGGQPNLDNQNDGFTAFGQVIGDGMEVVDEISSLPVIDMGPRTAFASLPLVNYTQQDLTNEAPITDENRVMIYRVTVIDPAVDTAADLEPMLAIKQSPPPPKKKKKSGAPGSEFLLVLAGLALSRRWWKQ
jgi:peptidyl-prolyl cis-trans isomerase A (cyclophilin A)